ncbi:MAG: hypothetical protein E6Q26_03065 [Acinetobacter sp.]|nr:MAG: hypothetical protein E6Q26_03065 [Acinetobacter sp.]
MKYNFQKANAIFFIFLCLIYLSAFLNIDQTLSTFVSKFSTLLILVTLLSLAFIIYDAIIKIKLKKKQTFDFSEENKSLTLKVKSLSHEEKTILSLYLNDKIQEKALHPNDHAVAWLESIKFIVHTGKIDGHKKIFRIDPTLVKYLQKNPNALY